jgi:hypothetical protein
MQTDERSFRVAVVASELVNGELAPLGVLERAGWGAIVLPPAWYPEDVANELLVQFAEHIEEFVRHGYRVVCIGSCERLSAPLGELGIELPDTITAQTEDELLRLLERAE